MGCVAAVFITFFAIYCSESYFGSKKLISRGVRIGRVNVGGMTEDQAMEAVSDYTGSVIDREAVITAGNKEITASFGAIGVEARPEDSVKKALSYGKDGNLLKRMADLRKADRGKVSFDDGLALSQDSVKAFVKERLKPLDRKVRNTKLKLVGGKLKGTKDREGIRVRVKKTSSTIYNALSSELKKGRPLEITADVKITKPDFTRADVRECDDLLGSFSTSYASSSSDRAANVENAVHFINGTVLEPGKVFSTIKTIKDRTVKNGYRTAPEYSDGMVVDGIGGGVCQVATTLYNAVIYSELEVVQRSPHSMVVAYVPHSRDAAISGNYKDFKFRNNTDHPVYIMGSASGGVLSFRIYGKETRDSGRTFEFVSEDTETIEPGDPKEVTDSSLAPGTRVITQPAHVGYKSRLWKYIYEDGKLTDKVQVNTSTYNAVPEYISVGPSATPAPTPEASGEPESTSSPADQESKSTEKPEAESSGSSEKKGSTESEKKVPAESEKKGSGTAN